jgi:hypothetical protein
MILEDDEKGEFMLERCAASMELRRVAQKAAATLQDV